MTPIVKLITVPQIDWDTFLKSVNAIIGKSPTRTLDASISGVRELPAFVTALENINCSVRPENALRHNCEHINISLLIHCDLPTLFGFLRPGFLTATTNLLSDNTVLIVATGSIIKWKSLVIDSAKEAERQEIRSLADSIYIILQKLGFEDVFENLTKRSLSDQTFIIESRK